MYWGRPGHRPVGGKMLIKILLVSFYFLSLNAFGCWKVEGNFAVDGESWKINHKFEHNKEYIFPMGTFILKMTIKPGKTQTLTYVVQEKKGAALVLITEGEEAQIKTGQSQDIFAKGLAGQPNSIITVKLTNI